MEPRISHVMKTLGHRKIKNTRYPHLVNFPNDDYALKAARSVQEAAELIEPGFEYICDVDGTKPFRKRKMIDHADGSSRGAEGRV